MRKFVTQLVRRLPKNSADAVPEAAERLEVEQTQVAILLPREPETEFYNRKRILEQAPEGTGLARGARICSEEPTELRRKARKKQ